MCLIHLNCQLGYVFKLKKIYVYLVRIENISVMMVNISSHHFFNFIISCYLHIFLFNWALQQLIIIVMYSVLLPLSLNFLTSVH